MSALQPSYIGFIGSTKDALLVIQAALDKKIPTVSRRPLHRERNLLIRLGHVFVFIEERSGIKRWTDGVSWSASRILGRFLVYRQLDTSSVREKHARRKNSRKFASVLPRRFGPGAGARASIRPAEDHGLIKKTISVALDSSAAKSETVHLISYYSAHDVLSGKLTRPTQGNLAHIDVLRRLSDSVGCLSLGGKTPSGDEAQYFLDSSYQLLDMLVFSVADAEPRKIAHDSADHSNLRLAADSIAWLLQETALMMHYLQPPAAAAAAAGVLHLAQGPFLLLLPPYFPTLHQPQKYASLGQLDYLLLQLPQQMHTLHLHASMLQPPMQQVPEQSTHVLQMLTQQFPTPEDLHTPGFHASPYSSETLPFPLGSPTLNAVQGSQFLLRPSLYARSAQQNLAADHFATDHSDRDSSDHYYA